MLRSQISAPAPKSAEVGVKVCSTPKNSVPLNSERLRGYLELAPEL